jgi:hypothetical protein
MTTQRKPNVCWRIHGYDSTTLIFDQTIPISQMTETSLKELLRALAGKYLSPSEIVGAYAKRGTIIFNGFLEIRQENDVKKRRTVHMCGHNPHFVATVTRS